MKLSFAAYPLGSLALLCAGLASANPVVVDTKLSVTYNGVHRNGIEAFLNIRYGQDTSGANRFKPPRIFVPKKGSVVHADSYGHSCPQDLDEVDPAIGISEDCLNLNIARPKGTNSRSKLPVMVYIVGGGFFVGSSSDAKIQPDTLVVESAKNGLPVIHVAMNYRLGVFGFAQSGALKAEGSENAAMRDHRLALEWVRDNIAVFGGDPSKVTIFGQSSGGLAVGMQILDYGAKKPAPFHQAICQSQALEPGITANFSIDAVKAIADYTGCNKTDLHSKETISCLRELDTVTLLNASVATWNGDINSGDIWLPTVDGDFLPSAPSDLINEGRFANVSTTIGWCQDEVTAFLDPNMKTEQDTRNFLLAFCPSLSDKNMNKLLSLYPIEEFPANTEANLSSEVYRSGRIVRDILMVCQPLYFADHINAKGNTVHLYDWNTSVVPRPGLSAIHEDDLAYVFGNFTNFKEEELPFNPSTSDYNLLRRASRSWSSFANTGKFSLNNHDTLQGFHPAFRNNQINVFVESGEKEGLSPIDGPHATEFLKQQKLRERCAFINSPEMIRDLKY